MDPSRYRPPYLPSLTALRYFAALGILIGHSLAAFRLPDLPIWVGRGLGAGVSFFFVLSGFVLTLNHADLKWASWGQYYFKRLSRIVPLYWFAGIFAVIVLLLRGRWDRSVAALDVLPGDAWTALGLFFTMLQAWVPLGDYQTAFNAPAWSLSVEGFFYLTLPFLLLLSTRRLVGFILPLCLIFAGASIFATDVFPWFNRPARSSVVGYFFPPARMLEFVAGVITARIFIRRQRQSDVRPPSRQLTLGLILLGLLCIVFWSGGRVDLSLPLEQWFGPNASRYFVQCGGALPFAVAIYCFALADGTTDRPWPLRFLASPPMQLLGNASFALYLLHVPLRTAVTPTFTQPWWGFAAYFLLAHVVSIAAYRLIERPAQRGLNGWYRLLQDRRKSSMAPI